MQGACGGLCSPPCLLFCDYLPGCGPVQMSEPPSDRAWGPGRGHQPGGSHTTRAWWGGGSGWRGGLQVELRGFQLESSGRLRPQ